jgi:hypothetical protein
VRRRRAAVLTKKKTLDVTHVLNAFYGPIRNRFATHLFGEKDSESPVEDVKVPASLATSILEAAENHRRLEAARHEIGPKLSDSGLCRDLDGDGKPREKATDPALK